MARRRASIESLTSLQVIALAGFAIGLIGLLAKLITREYPLWLAAISMLVLFGCATYWTRRWLIPVVKYLHPHLVNVGPWLVTVLVVLSALILYYVWPFNSLISISFDSRKAAVYNSWQHQKTHTKHLEAIGVGDTFAWIVSDDGRTGGFHFKVRRDEKASSGASSGGYITFYGQPCDRLQYRTVCFRCKVTDASGDPDVGIRLSVDNPKATGDREVISYEIKSLANYATITDQWQMYEVPISAFQQVRYEPPFPADLDENTINKIAFFVDNEIASQCEEGTFWFGDIDFRP